MATSLPLRRYQYFAGIDPGMHGAIATMNAPGTSVRVFPMPVREGEIDLDELRAIYRRLALLPDLYLGIEWPQPWPGAFNNVIRDAECFGRQKGYLEAMAVCHRIDYGRISPVMWKGRLGLDGKTIEGANDRAAKLFDTYYPEHRSLCHGPRGGLLDGPLDALLIAHFLRTRTGSGMKSIADRFGKDSVEALAFILGGARRKRKFGKRKDSI